MDRLPDELLAEKLEYNKLWVHRCDWEECWGAITLISSRWQRIYPPVMYRGIDLLSADDWPKDKLCRFDKTLQEPPELRR